MQSTIEFNMSKETKGAYQYKATSDGAAVDTIYIRKEALPAGLKPQQVKILLEVPE